MASIHVPREDEPGPFYGHPAVYIGLRGIPLGRSWAVYAADGGAHDRHTLKALTGTERQAEAIAAELISRGPSKGGQSFGYRSGVIRPVFGPLSGGRK